MKKYIIIFAVLLSTATLQAQHFDNEPVLSVGNEAAKLKFSVGARLMSDFAYYHTDFTPMKSGAAISDARIRTSLAYNDWYFYGDFDFSGGKFHQKDFFLQYTFPTLTANKHRIRAGYYTELSSMSLNTSRYSYHFISRSVAANALQTSRSLGVSYLFSNDAFTLQQGVFAENKYNDQQAGFQGGTLSGRWLFRPIACAGQTLHIGVAARYATLNTGKAAGDKLQTSQTLAAPFETLVDGNTKFLSAEIPWAKNVFYASGEALYHNEKFFARGEYMYKHITKERPDADLFNSQLGGVWSWTSLASWQKGNPIRSNNFSGAYLEMGFQLFGNGYAYSKEDGLLLGSKGKSLEVVARYSHANLNDIVAGEFFLIGKQKFYPGGEVSDYPAVSTSVGGGKVNAATIGLNYTFNKYAQIMLDYTYSKLNNVYFPMDNKFHTVQGRLMFSF
jgi:phosphate-selective porin OprO/OprP